jgi:hypothetical protein
LEARGKKEFFCRKPPGGFPGLFGLEMGCSWVCWAAPGKEEERERIGLLPKNRERERVFSLFENLFLFCNQNPLLFSKPFEDFKLSELLKMTMSFLTL